MIIAIIALGLLAGASGLLLGFAAIRFKVEGDPLVDRICEDPRHQNVTALLQEPLTAARRYPDWSMAFSEVGSDSVIDRLITEEPRGALEILQQAHLTLDLG